MIAFAQWWAIVGVMVFIMAAVVSICDGTWREVRWVFWPLCVLACLLLWPVVFYELARDL